MKHTAQEGEKVVGVAAPTTFPIQTKVKPRKCMSTATEAQYDRLIKLLRTGPKNTLELRRNGVMAPAARTKELREIHGYDLFRSGLGTVWDEWGFAHANVATYELVGEPDCRPFGGGMQ